MASENKQRARTGGRSGSASRASMILSDAEDAPDAGSGRSAGAERVAPTQTEEQRLVDAAQAVAAKWTGKVAKVAREVYESVGDRLNRIAVEVMGKDQVAFVKGLIAAHEKQEAAQRTFSQLDKQLRAAKPGSKREKSLERRSMNAYLKLSDARRERQQMAARTREFFPKVALNIADQIDRVIEDVVTTGAAYQRPPDPNKAANPQER